MATTPASVLAINGGSSSIKFAVYQTVTPRKTSLSGKLDRIGSSGTTLSWHAQDEGSGESHVEAPDHERGRSSTGISREAKTRSNDYAGAEASSFERPRSRNASTIIAIPKATA
ncbi:MAG: hypothetical protein ACRD3V_24705 [Vicinamibacteria bacterium]